jgi:hypothetical protein
LFWMWPSSRTFTTAHELFRNGGGLVVIAAGGVDTYANCVPAGR